MATATTTPPTAPDGPLKIGLRFGLVGLACVSFALASWALAWALADLQAGAARTFIRDVAIRGRSSAPGQFGAAARALRFALHANPLNADYAVTLGRLNQWQAWQQPAKADAAAYRRAAIFRYRQGLNLRPSWGSAWAELAEAEVLLNGLTRESRHALRRAGALGRFEVDAQRKVLWMGMSNWQSLDDVEKNVVRDVAVARVLIDDPFNELAAMADRYGWGEELAAVRRQARAGQSTSQRSP